MTVAGIDVAHYQPDDYATHGLDFVFVKATEGSSYVNPKHAGQVATARAAGLVVGHYHFARAGSMTAQADYFLAHAAPKAGDVLAFDWEDQAVSCAEKDAWLKYVKRKAPECRAVLYANLAFWHRDTTSYCADGLWIADPSAPKGQPRVEHPWVFHQYSEAGGVDHNVGNFPSAAALRSWAAGTTPNVEDNVTLTAAAVWDADVIPAARPPHANADYEKNPKWRASYALQTIAENSRSAAGTGEEALAQARANGAALSKLAGQVGAVHLDDTQVPALAAALAGNPTFVTALAAALAENLADRMQS